MQLLPSRSRMDAIADKMKTDGFSLENGRERKRYENKTQNVNINTRTAYTTGRHTYSKLISNGKKSMQGKSNK